MAAEAIKAFVPPAPTFSKHDRAKELKRLLRVTAVMFFLALVVAVVLGIQLKRVHLQIDTLGISTFSALKENGSFTIFSAELQSRDGVHGAVLPDPDPGSNLVVLGFGSNKWEFDHLTRSLRSEDGRYLGGTKDAIVTDEQPSAAIDIFVEPWSNRMYIHSAGLWLVRAPYPPRNGGRCKLLWTASAQSVPELFFGSWNQLPSGLNAKKGRLAVR